MIFKPTYKLDFDKENLSGFTGWKSPSNIALIKYWGKKELQIPMNPSLSFTLTNCYSSTTIDYSFSKDGFKYEFYFHDELKPEFNKKLDIFFERVIEYLPVLQKLSLKIKSKNTFPHSSGIASSASAFSSLALCLVDIEKSITKIDDFYSKSSFISRLGSGSACRSVYGPAAIWGETNIVADSNNLYSIPFKLSTYFDQYCDTILIVDEGSKSVSSSVGHDLMNKHQFKNNRIHQANKNFEKINQFMKHQNVSDFSKIVENEALTLHAMMLSSNPSFILFKPNTINIINKVWSFRKQNDCSLCFTLDAGANLHLLYHKNDFDLVQKFVKNELLVFCSGEKYIDDKLGSGPEKIISS